MAAVSLFVSDCVNANQKGTPENPIPEVANCWCLPEVAVTVGAYRKLARGCALSCLR
jgi:hypothetical protein